ncbi:MAG TPA: MASE3 domain-containing protein [Thermoleophilia bacterium]|nr:MASE3 domain-containing protein [Thermoleophilia bacterium]
MEALTVDREARRRSEDLVDLIAGGFVVVAALYLLRAYSYPLFHVFSELFSVVVAVTIFMIAWNTRRIASNSYFLFVGIGLLFVGLVDGLHALAFRGMNIFDGTDADLPTQLWLAARYLQTATLVGAPLVIGRALRGRAVFVAFGVATAALLWSIFGGHFPVAFVEGQGLTTFKVGSEYLISALLVTAFWLTYFRRDYFEPRVLRLVMLSIALTVAGEVAFTLYTEPFGLANFIGHFLKIAAFYFIYKSLVEITLVQPYGVLFRGLKQSEEALRDSEQRYRKIADSLQESLLSIPSELPGVEFGHLYRSATLATRVGGDFYDIFELESGRIGVLMGDVSGKGLRAAAITSVVKNSVRAYAYNGAGPAETMRLTNTALFRTIDQQSFVTAFYGVLDTKTGTLAYCSAGHPPALINRAQGTRSLDVRSPVLGAFPDLRFEEGEDTVGEDEILVLYTDGVTEARRGAEFFGEEGLVRALNALNGTPASETPDVLFRGVLSFSQGQLRDDVAILAVKPTEWTAEAMTGSSAELDMDDHAGDSEVDDEPDVESNPQSEANAVGVTS